MLLEIAPPNSNRILGGTIAGRRIDNSRPEATKYLASMI